MSRTLCIATGVLICAAAAWLAPAQNSPITGQWTIGGPMVQDTIQLGIRRTSANSNMSSSWTTPLAQLRGLTRAQLDSTGTVTRFELVREAGTLRFDGFVQNGGGGGTFTFTPNPAFPGGLRALGYSAGLTDEKVFSMAVHDVSTAYVRDLAALGVHADSTDQLITMRIHNVTPDYVRQLQTLGQSELKPDKLVTMRIHSVTPEFVREFRDQGYTDLSADKLVTMRIHSVTPEFSRELKDLGYGQVSADQMVTMRIHSVTPEFIRKTRAKGLGNLPVDQLVQLKIHGILD